MISLEQQRFGLLDDFTPIRTQQLRDDDSIDIPSQVEEKPGLEGQQTASLNQNDTRPFLEQCPGAN